MTQLTTPLPKLTQAADETDSLVSQLAGLTTAAIAAMHRAATLNTGFASTVTMVQFATQMLEAVRKLSDTGRDHAEGLRYTVQKKVALEQESVDESTLLRSRIAGSSGPVA